MDETRTEGLGMTSAADDLAKAFRVCRWAPAYLWQKFVRKSAPNPFHLIIAIADHFEPYIIPNSPRTFLPRQEQVFRVKRWCESYPQVFDQWRDHSGSPLKHTYFYPAEHYDPLLLEVLAKHCRLGWGEIEVHLHHGIDSPDTAENTRNSLVTMRDHLVNCGCLCHLDGSSEPRYGFVHGNWALANSAGGKYCGVDCELQILAETGCYADFTLPSAPNVAQVSKINALYECNGLLGATGSHARGRDLACGSAPTRFPLIIQGPLMLRFDRRKRGVLPTIENSALTAANPPTSQRLELWTDAGIQVSGRPDWIFVKLHCHGMDPRDTPTLLGQPLTEFLEHMEMREKKGDFQAHFVTAREMTNIVLAACDGKNGNPSDFKNYRLRLIHGHPGAVGRD